MGFLSAKRDLPVHQKFIFNFFCIGVHPIHLYVLGSTCLFFGTKCLWTLKNKNGIALKIPMYKWFHFSQDL